MIQFPPQVAREWQDVATASTAVADLKIRLERGTQIEREVERLRIRHAAKLAFDAELSAAETPELEMMTLHDYNNTPSAAPVDLIEGVMSRDGVCVVVGPSRSGKTTLGLQMVGSLMSGTPWLGQKVNYQMTSAGVLSYDMEAARMMDWLSGNKAINPRRVSVVNAHGRGNPLAVPKQRAEIAAHWRDKGVEVVLLDSFSASFPGTDQNDAGATMAYYTDIKKFAFGEVGAKAIILIVHSTDAAPRKPRGSSTHIDTCDSMVAVVPDDSGLRQVDMMKYRQRTNGCPEMSPRIITAPDPVTHQVSLDPGAMILKNLPVPGAAGKVLFPETTPEPQTNTDFDESETD